MGRLAGDRKTSNDPAFKIGFTFAGESAGPLQADLDEFIAKINVINETAAQLVGVEEEKQIFPLILKAAHGLLPEAILIASALDTDGETMRIVGHQGLNPFREAIGRILGADLLQMSFPLGKLDAADLELYRSGRLHHFEEGLYPLSTSLIPPLICKAIEKLLDLGEVWAIGITWGGRHYGALNILLPGDQTINEPAFIETIVHQAAIAIRRVRAEQRLRFSEMALKKAQAVAHVGSWAWHIKTDRLEWSDEMYRIFGIDQASFSGQLPDVIAAAIHPDDRAAVERSNRSVITDKKPIPLEYRVIRPDGTVRTVWAEAGELVLDDSGEPSMLTGIVQDITERKQAEERLRASETKLRTIIQMLPVGISILDSERRITETNPALERILGLSAAELQDGSYTRRRYITTEGATISEEGFPSVRAGREQRVIADEEIGVVKQDGTTVWTSVSAAPLPIEGLSVAVVTSDITARKRAEAERLRLEQQIQQSQRLESLGVLAGGIAHDFNNLLGGLYGYIDLAAVSCTQEKVKQHLIQAMASMSRARSLTQQLLTFAKGGAPLRKPAPLIPFVKDTVQFALSGSAVGCHYDIAPDLWPCDIDVNQIAQVIDNIVINALHAMPQGGSLHVLARNHPIGRDELPLLAAGRYVLVSIRDTGLGISGEILPRIFDPFFTTKQKGSGLGLATAFSIVKRHGGHLDVDSRPGAGSTFRIFLPACPEAISANRPSAAPSPARTAGRILIMDDEEVIRNIVRIILTDEGYGVTCVREGREAVRVLSEEAAAGRPFSAVILDLTIAGGMGGKQTLAEIRKHHATIPVFVASGYASDPIMANPAEHGFTDGLSKPFSITELTGLLRRHLDDEAG